MRRRARATCHPYDWSVVPRLPQFLVRPSPVVDVLLIFSQSVRKSQLDLRPDRPEPEPDPTDPKAAPGKPDNNIYRARASSIDLFKVISLHVPSVHCTLVWVGGREVRASRVSELWFREKSRQKPT